MVSGGTWPQGHKICSKSTFLDYYLNPLLESFMNEFYNKTVNSMISVNYVNIHVNMILTKCEILN